MLASVNFYNYTDDEIIQLQLIFDHEFMELWAIYLQHWDSVASVFLMESFE